MLSYCLAPSLIVLYELSRKGHFRFTSHQTYRPGLARSGKSRIPSITEQSGVLRSNNKRLCYGSLTARRTCQQKFCNYKTSHLKPLSCGIIYVMIRLAILIQYRNVTDTHTQTDGQTHDDGIPHIA